MWLVTLPWKTAASDSPSALSSRPDRLHSHGGVGLGMDHTPISSSCAFSSASASTGSDEYPARRTHLCHPPRLWLQGGVTSARYTSPMLSWQSFSRICSGRWSGRSRCLPPAAGGCISILDRRTAKDNDYRQSRMSLHAGELPGSFSHRS